MCDSSLMGTRKEVIKLQLYNLWTCIAREAFPEFQSWSDTAWFVADIMCDVIWSR